LLTNNFFIQKESSSSALVPHNFAGKENQGGHGGQGEQKGRSGQNGGNKGGQNRQNGMGQASGAGDQAGDQTQQFSFAYFLFLFEIFIPKHRKFYDFNPSFNNFQYFQ
jgi:hypothetical protein